MQSSSKNVLPRKWLESNDWSFTILSCSDFDSAFVDNVVSFAFTSEFFTGFEKLDSSTNSFFVFFSSISLAKLF